VGAPDAGRHSLRARGGGFSPRLDPPILAWMEDLDERAIFVRGPVVVFRWRNAPGWPVEYVSANASEVFGHDVEAFLSGAVPYASLILPEDAERVGREVAEASGSELPTFMHEPYRIRHRDGSIHWLHDVTRVVRGPDGAPTHYLGYVIDVTARVEAQEQARELERRLLHAQKLESLGVLAGGVAHDFNNLLTGILGHASLVRRSLSPASEPLRESVEQIELLARRAADLTRQLLAYSGRGGFVVEPVDLAAVVRETVAMLGVAVSRAVTLELELEHDLPAIRADRTQIQQIAMNLLTNAGEALEGRPGRVMLRTFARDTGVPGPPGREVVLEVSDTGVGMTDDVRQRLFDPFYTTKGAGRGLGMSAVLGIVRGHGGSIEVESTPGLGSTFRIAFPAVEGPVADPLGTAAAVRASWGGTILVVDDEIGVRETLTGILSHLGYRAAMASDGQEAIVALERLGDEIVAAILDLTMPGMSGLDTFEALRERRPSLPVILTSGFAEGDNAKVRDAAAFLQKPYAIEDLERTLARAVPARASS